MYEIPLCKHIKSNNIRCGSPALRGQRYCYHHARIHSGLAVNPDLVRRSVPLLNTRRRIRLAADNIYQCLALGHIDEPTAQVMLEGLRMANKLLDRPVDLRSLPLWLRLYPVPTWIKAQ